MFIPKKQAPITFAFSGRRGHEGRRGLHMHVSSGKFFFPCDPREEEIEIEDIAHHLGMQVRFAGACEQFVSVAEHCFLCSTIEAPTPQDALEALMHDAAEAYLQDWIRPIKYLPEVRAVYTALETPLETVIARKFGLQYPWSKWVKHCDELVCNLEITNNIANPDKGQLHETMVVPADLRLLYLSPRDAKLLFLDRFHQLREQIARSESSLATLAA